VKVANIIIVFITILNFYYYYHHFCYYSIQTSYNRLNCRRCVTSQ